MIKKKLIAVALCLVVVGGAFAGCAKNDTKSASSSDVTTDVSKLKPYTIKWYTIGTPQKDLAEVNVAVNKYLKEKINADIQITQFDWGDYEPKMNVKVNSGEKFDLAFTCSWSLNYKLNAKKGAFLELNDLMDKYGKEMTKLIDPNFISGNKIDGKLFAVPNNKEIGQQSVFRFNKKYVDKYNIDVTKYSTYQSLEPILKQVHEGEPSLVSPLRIGNVELNYDFLEDKLPIVMDLDTNTGKLENWVDTKKAQDYMATARKYYQAGYIRKDVVAALKNGGDENTTGSWFVDTAGTQPYAEQLWSTSLGYPVVINPINPPVTNNTSVSGSMIAISATAENPERDMMFLNLLNSDVYLRNLINYGIEGKHYTKTGDNFETQTAAGIKDYNVPAFALGNVLITYLPTGTPADKWAKFAEFNKSSKNSPMLGFDFNTDSLKTEIASLKSVRDEFNDALVSGSVDPTVYIPKYQAKLKAAGLDKVMAEAQKQYDAFKAKK